MKTHDTLPDIGIVPLMLDGKPYTLSKLPHDDVRALFMGKVSGCCLSIGDQGAKGAIQGFTEQDAAFYVLKNANGHIMGQGRVWRGSEDGEMVIDAWVGPSAQNPKKANVVSSSMQDYVILEHLALALKKGGATNISVGVIVNSFTDSFVYPVIEPYKYKGKDIGYSDAERKQYAIIHEEMPDELLTFHSELINSEARLDSLVQAYNALPSDEAKVFALKCAFWAKKYDLAKTVYSQNHKPYEAQSAAQVAAFLGDEEFLNTAKYDLNVTDNIGNLVAYATLGRKSATVSNLITKEVNPDIKSTGEHPVTPIQIAAYYGDLETVKVLATAMRNIDPNADLSEALILAATSDRLDVISYFVKEQKVDVNSKVMHRANEDKADSYDTALAVANGFKTVKFLIDLGADIIIAAHGKHNCLREVVHDIRVLQYIIKHMEERGDAAEHKAIGNQLLMHAAHAGKVDIMRLLVSKGLADANGTITVHSSITHEGKEPEKFTSSSSILEFLSSTARIHDDVIKCLLELGANIYALSPERLLYNKQVFALLCNYASAQEAARDDHQTEWWNRAFISAVHARNTEAIELLLTKHLVDVNVTLIIPSTILETGESSSYKTTPLQLAVSNGDIATIKSVMKYTNTDSAGIASLAQQYPYGSSALLTIAQEQNDFAEHRHKWLPKMLQDAASQGIDTLRALVTQGVDKDIVASILPEFIYRPNGRVLLEFALEIGVTIDDNIFNAVVYNHIPLSCVLDIAKSRGEFETHKDQWGQRLTCVMYSDKAESLIPQILSYGVDIYGSVNGAKILSQAVHSPHLKYFIAQAKTRDDAKAHKQEWLQVLYDAAIGSKSDVVQSIIVADLADPKENITVEFTYVDGDGASVQSSYTNNVFATIVRNCNSDAVSAALAHGANIYAVPSYDLSSATPGIVELLFNHAKALDDFATHKQEWCTWFGDPGIKAAITTPELIGDIDILMSDVGV